MGVAAAYRVIIDGRDVTAEWRRARRLLDVDVDDREGEASDSCSLVLDDRKPHVEWPPEGATLRLWLGNTDADMVDMGTFTLDAPEASGPPDRVSVRGHAANYVASGKTLPMQTERSRVWTAITLGDLAATIAIEHGLVSRIQPALAAELVDGCEQVDESDLQFLSRIAKRYEARVRVKGATGSLTGALEVVGAGSQLPQLVLTRADIEQWSAPLGGRLKPGSVLATWHNPRTGASGLKRAGNADPRMVLAEVFESASAAASACQSKLNDGDRQAAQISLTLTTMNTGIASGAAIALAGFRSEIDTIWNVVQARHHAGGTRARTTLVAERTV